MRFMMLMIPKGYEKAARGAMPDAKAVAAMMEYNESCKRPACCSRSMASTRLRWARACRSPEESPE